MGVGVACQDHGNADILKTRAQVLIQEITVLEGSQAELEMQLEETNASLNEATNDGQAVAVAVLHKAVENCNVAIADISQKRLQLEIEYYEVQGDILDIEDAQYSAKLCSAIDKSQLMKFPLLAVRFTWLIALESTLKLKYPEKLSSEFTMSFLSRNYVGDETMNSGLSLCDHLISDGDGKKVGLATHYIVYSQSMHLSDFVDSLQSHFAMHGMVHRDAHEHIFVWVDIFSFTQDAIMLQSLDLNPTWYDQCLAPALNMIGKAIIVLDHKKCNPVLKSSWALMEMYQISISSTIEVEICMSKDNIKGLIDEASIKGTRRVFPQAASLNLSTSSISGKKEDMILALEASSATESEFHEVIKKFLEDLMSNYLYSLIAHFKGDSNVPYMSLVSCVLGDFCQVRCRYEEAEQSFKYSLKLARQLYGNLDPRTIRVVKKMIKFYEATSAFDKAEDLRNFGRPNRDKSGGDIVTLKGADIQVVSRKGQDGL